MAITNIRYAAGIDLGGTFVKLALVSEEGKISFQDKIEIGPKATRDDILKTLSLAIQKIIAHANLEGVKLAGIGIGSPGIIYDGVVIGGADNLNGWANVPLGTIFSKEFNLPVFADNDANVMGLGEVEFGAAKGCTDAIFLTVGTGIGGAIVMNGQLYGGYKNRGTEMGHVTIDHKGIACNCGGRGCLEAYASTNALIGQYSKQTGKNGNEINGYYIVEKFLEGETAAVECMQEHTDYLGHAIAGFINTFAPQKVIIGGGISEAGQFYIDMIKASTFNYAMSDCAVHTDVIAATLGNNAGCMGAASLVFRNSN
ncbi:MAG: ROK family protein [Mariniphaga sp.]